MFFLPGTPQCVVCKENSVLKTYLCAISLVPFFSQKQLLGNILSLKGYKRYTHIHSYSCIKLTYRDQCFSPL